MDGQFQAAGYSPERIVECHGSIHHLQRIDESSGRIWDAGCVTVEVDATTMKTSGILPADPESGKLARPNIQMFNDAFWNPERTEAQHRRYREWLTTIQGARMVVIEIGAGRANPTVRRESERLIASHGAKLIRINPREYDVPRGHFAVDYGALSGLKLLNLVSERYLDPP